MMRTWRQRLLIATLALTAQGGATAIAQPTSVVEGRSEQSLTLRGKRLDYTVEAGLVPVSSAPGRNDASAGYIAYVRKGRAAERPVVFVFNGGPGAASAYLNMGALGPMRAQVPQDPAAPLPATAPVAPNSAPLLDIADLVFLDPPGTGFSAIQPGADLSFYHSTRGDADAVAQAARNWLIDHERRAAPLFILGESYGTIRAAAMVDALKRTDPELKLRGVLLLGQALNMIETSQRPDNVVTYPVALPTLAALACYHHKRPAPCDPQASAAQASAFGRTYLDALYQGRALPAAERDRIAARLEDLTGVSRTFYLGNELRISKERFRVELLRHEGKVLGRYDARYTAPLPPGASTMVGPDAFAAVSDLYGKAIIHQLARIGVKKPERYQVISPVSGEWAYGAGDSPFNDWPFMARLEQAMAADAKLRLFVGTGLYDLTTTVGAADYLFAQSNLAPDRFVNRSYRAGHVAYSDDASWRALIGDIREFIEVGTAQ
jgi:carboxypeptidase C (cathepsin A)